MEIRISVDDRLVAALRALRSVASRRRVAVVLGGAVLAGGALAVAAPLEKPHEFAAGDVIRASEMNESFDALVEAINALTIREDLVIELEEEDGCDGIRQALLELDEKRIVSTATVTLELGPGDYACDEPLVVAHANGDRLRIAGSATDDVTLTFPADVDGILLDNGNALGGLENLTLAGGDGTSSGFGIHVQNGSSLVGLNGVVVRDFRDGIRATNASSIRGEDVVAESNTRDGVQAVVGGSLWLTSSIAQDNGNSGFAAAEGGVMSLATCTASSNANNGFVANHGSTITASSPTASGNTSGFWSSRRSTISTSGVLTATSNSSYGITVGLSALVSYDSSEAVFSGNGTNTGLSLDTLSSNGSVIATY